jgi:hypothetical protein
VSKHWPARSGAVLSAALLSVLLLPPVFFYVGAASSLALGASLAGALIVAMLVDPAAVYRWCHGSNIGFATVLAVLIVLGIAVHLVLAAMFLAVDWRRAGASIVPLVLVFWSAYALGRTLDASTNAAINGAVRICFAVFCLIAAVAVARVSPGSSDAYFKPVFPFSEPSYFALAFVPLLMYRCVTSAGARRVLMLLIGLAAAVLLQNLTLLLGCLLTAFISFRPMAVILLTVPLAVTAMQLDLSYYLARLNLSSETQNLSSLVYVQGWQLIAESLSRSGGWGLGFQQLGVQGTNVWAAGIIYDLTSGYSNLLDGGFTFAKLVSEFGVIGLVLTLLYLLTAQRAIRALRFTARHRGSPNAALTLSRCIIASFVLELFVRGSGYFAGTTMLMVASLWVSALPRPHPASSAEAAVRL